MTLTDLGIIANFLSPIAVLATLVFLSRQVQQGNRLAMANARQRMVEQTNDELYTLMSDAALRECFVKADELSQDEQSKLHCFLTAAMRQREWEWFQHRDRIIEENVAKSYFEIIAIHLGTPRTRYWWKVLGHLGFNPNFVAEVDQFIARRPPTNFFECMISYDTERLAGS
jgi:hypothetical protein